MVDAQVITPQEYVGAIMELCQDKRGTFRDMKYIEGGRVVLNYDLPLNEVIYDFFDQLKSRTRGYASFDYELKGYVKSDLVKLDMLLNGDTCDALSIIVHKDRAYARGRSIAEKLKEAIPRQLFEIPIQAAIGGKIIARETISGAICPWPKRIWTQTAGCGPQLNATLSPAAGGNRRGGRGHGRPHGETIFGGSRRPIAAPCPNATMKEASPKNEGKKVDPSRPVHLGRSAGGTGVLPLDRLFHRQLRHNLESGARHGLYGPDRLAVVQRLLYRGPPG